MVSLAAKLLNTAKCEWRTWLTKERRICTVHWRSDQHSGFPSRVRVEQNKLLCSRATDFRDQNREKSGKTKGDILVVA